MAARASSSDGDSRRTIKLVVALVVLAVAAWFILKQVTGPATGEIRPEGGSTGDAPVMPAGATGLPPGRGGAGVK